VLAFNALFKLVHERRGPATRGTVEASWLNIALTAAGFEILEAPSRDAFPEDFRQGMRARAEVIGDVGPSAPSEWAEPFKSEVIHAVLVFAADDLDDLTEEYDLIKGTMAQHNVTEVGSPIEGDARPDPMRGHEHFGFKDGVSQPGIEGLTESSHEGTDQIAAGEFICGYPGEGEEASPSPVDNGYSQPPAPPLPTGLPEWTKDGSFLVFRRLRQDVGGFRQAMADQAGEVGISSDQLGAKLVGRWPSGAPLAHTPGEQEGLDPEAADPKEADPDVLADGRINNFNYDADPEGRLMPRAAHIRKANPRSQTPPGKADSNRHRILRRGITYGLDFNEETEGPYAETIPDERDRGLLFLSYQASIERGFEFIQNHWVSQPDFPRNGDGEDAVIAQRDEPRPFTLPQKEGDPHALSFAQWVHTRGGEYFFAPSISALKLLGETA
jgi:Dyp-type peroxidase family